MSARRIAREGVIFMLLGPIVAAPIIYGFLVNGSRAEIKAEASRAVYSLPTLPQGFTPAEASNYVIVPLTNKDQLWVTDCAQAHPVTITPDVTPPAVTLDLSKSQPVYPLPAGYSNGTDCIYFSDPYGKYGGHLISVPLGNPNQVEIEKQYWTAYKKAASERRPENLLTTGFFSLWGFPAGVSVWLFYRLVRFAVKG
jgi:hypothetical protein